MPTLLLTFSFKKQSECGSLVFLSYVSLSLLLFVLYHDLIHKARTHLDYFQEGNPGRAWSSCSPVCFTTLIKCMAFPRSLGVSGTLRAIPGPSCEIHDLSQMSSISAEFGSLPTHLQPEDMGPGTRSLKLQIWQICWSLGSFALTGNAARAPVLHARSAALGPILFIKNGVWEFQEVEVLEPSFVQPGH